MTHTFRNIVLAGLMLLPLHVFGQEDEGLDDEFALLEEEIRADEVESASKHRQSILWSPSAVSVITREEILASGATNLPDLLRRVPGMDVYEMKPTFPLVGARALTDNASNLVLVLVDGREALIELSGFPLWAAMTIDIEEIERIEVIRGPGSTLYGANAFAAVVSITTMSEQPRRFAGKAYLTGGQQGLWRFFGRVGDAWKAGEGILSFSAGAGSEEFRSASDREDRIGRVKIRFHSFVRYQFGSRLDLSLHGGLIEGAGSMFETAGDFLADNVVNHYAMAKASIALADSLSLKAQLYQVRYHVDLHYRSRIFAYGTWIMNLPDNMMDINTYDGQLQTDWQPAGWLHLVGGANLRYTYLQSDKIFASVLDELRGALFVNSEWKPLDALQLTAGFRLDLNSETEPAFSPRIVAVYRPLRHHSFRLGYSLAFRKPSFMEGLVHLQPDDFNPAFPEIVDKFTKSVGNENLKNERLHSIELGWRGRFLERRLQASIDLFYNFYLDTIFYKSEMSISSLGMPDIANSIFQFCNNPDLIEAFGGEIELSWNLPKDWRIWGNLGLRRVTQDGRRLPSEPWLRANLGLSFDRGSGLVADISLHYVTSYTVELMSPENPFDNDKKIIQSLGNRLLAIGRLGYRMAWEDDTRLEAGLSVRTPIGPPFREYAGIPILNPDSYSITGSDWAGEKLVRLVTFYLRGSF